MYDIPVCKFLFGRFVVLCVVVAAAAASAVVFVFVVEQPTLFGHTKMNIFKSWWWKSLDSINLGYRHNSTEFLLMRYNFDSFKMLMTDGVAVLHQKPNIDSHYFQAAPFEIDSFDCIYPCFFFTRFKQGFSVSIEIKPFWPFKSRFSLIIKLKSDIIIHIEDYTNDLIHAPFGQLCPLN